MKKIDRRSFLKNSLGLTAGTLGGYLIGVPGTVLGESELSPHPDLVAIRNGSPDVMFDRAIKSLGGIERFVKKGHIVLVKPNIGWNQAPESGANTNPLLVKRIVEHCVMAGAKKVYVLDNTVSWPWKAYEKSGIEAAAKDAGAKVIAANREKYYHQVDIPSARVLTKTKIHELYLEADTIINVPVLKHHSSAQITSAMKNLMGIVWDRRWYHRHGLHQSIADFCLHRKPDLNVVDAYRMTTANGPSRARPQDIVLKKSLLLSTDIVAVDAAAAKLFGSEPKSIPYIDFAAKHKIGKADLNALRIKKFSL